MLNLSKSRYDENWIRNEIGKVQAALNIKRMPSRSEMNMITKATSLTNVVMRTGGFRYWANKLNLDIKGSESELGYTYEKVAQKHIEDMGYKAELTPVKFPYDILVNGVTKIDVKAGNKYCCPTGTSWYTFNIYSPYPKCDFLIVYCLDDNAVKATYVIPAHVMLGHRQLSMGKDTKYQKYADRWDLIPKHVEAMKACL